MTKKTSYEDLFNALNTTLRIGNENVKEFLVETCDLVSSTLKADKVDLFFYEEIQDALVAKITSRQPLSEREKRFDLDIQKLSNRGNVVKTFCTGVTFRSGDLKNDDSESEKSRVLLGAQSQINVALDLGLSRRGVLVAVSQKRNHFAESDQHLAEIVAMWVSLVVRLGELTKITAHNSLEHGRRIAAEEIVTVLAHDLRNFQSPLSIRLARMNFRAKAEKRNADEEDIQRCLDYLHRFDAMIAEHLDISRLDNGIFYLKKSVCDISALVTQVRNNLNDITKPISLEIEEGIIADIDSHRIKQCLENIIFNAINHSPNESPVFVLVKRKNRKVDSTVEIEVINTGPKIPHNFLGRIFDRYIVGKNAKKGLGLGLFLAKEIVTAHAGKITVHCKKKDLVSFTISLPCLAAVTVEQTREKFDITAGSKERPEAMH